jgi:hypothetical protein
MLSVTIKSIMLIVVMLNVVAPAWKLNPQFNQVSIQCSFFRPNLKKILWNKKFLGDVNGYNGDVIVKGTSDDLIEGCHDAQHDDIQYQ